MYDDSNFAFDLMDVISEEDISEKITIEDKAEMIDISVYIDYINLETNIKEDVSLLEKWFCHVTYSFFGDVSNVSIKDKTYSYVRYKEVSLQISSAQFNIRNVLKYILALNKTYKGRSDRFKYLFTNSMKCELGIYRSPFNIRSFESLTTYLKMRFEDIPDYKIDKLVYQSIGTKYKIPEDVTLWFVCEMKSYRTYDILCLDVSDVILNKELVEMSDLFFIDTDKIRRIKNRYDRFEISYDSQDNEAHEDYFSKQAEVLKQYFKEHLEEYPVVESYRITKILNHYKSEYEFKVVMFLGFIDNGETGAFGFLMLPDSYSVKLRTRKIRSAVKELIKKTRTQDD